MGHPQWSFFFFGFCLVLFLCQPQGPHNDLLGHSYFWQMESSQCVFLKGWCMYRYSFSIFPLQCQHHHQQLATEVFGQLISHWWHCSLVGKTCHPTFSSVFYCIWVVFESMTDIEDYGNICYYFSISWNLNTASDFLLYSQVKSGETPTENYWVTSKNHVGWQDFIAIAQFATNMIEHFIQFVHLITDKKGIFINN